MAIMFACLFILLSFLKICPDLDLCENQHNRMSWAGIFFTPFALYLMIVGAFLGDYLIMKDVQWNVSENQIVVQKGDKRKIHVEKADIVRVHTGPGLIAIIILNNGKKTGYRLPFLEPDVLHGLHGAIMNGQSR